MLCKGNVIYKECICPKCHNQLIGSDSELICNNCNTLFPIKNGIPCFASGSSDWKFFSKHDSNEIIKNAKEFGWENSLNRLEKNKADWVRGNERFPIAFLTSSKKRVLDLGCGWGGVSFWASSQFESVYGLDIELNGLEFINIRASQEGIQNITLVQGSVFALPFPDGFFDVILLNGVLEWIGTFTDDAHPLIMQERALREISRVIEPNGTLYIGIENRFGIQYFFGYKEEHTGIKFISLLPRKFAQIYHKKAKGGNYRALTHSRSALKKILIKSGFNYFEFFTAYPSYRNIRYAVSLNSTKPIAYFMKCFVFERFTLPAVFKRITEWILLKLKIVFRMGSFFSPSWVVFASKQKQPELVVCGDKEKSEKAKQENYVVAINTRRVNFFAIDKFTGKLSNKYSIPINDTAKNKIEISKFFIDLLIEQNPKLKNNVPNITICKNRKSYTEVTKAVKGSPLNINDEKSMNLFLGCLNTMSQVDISETKIEGLKNDFDVRNRLRQLVLKHNLSKQIMKFIDFPGVVHGDLNKNNIYITKRNEKRTVLLDFEHAKIGPFVLNWYDFMLRNLIIYGGKYPLNKNEFLRRFKKLPGNKNASFLHNKMTAKYLNANLVPCNLHKDLVVLYMAYLLQDPIIADPRAALGVIKSTNLII